jgi:arginyl-tRNA synthetase
MPSLKEQCRTLVARALNALKPAGAPEFAPESVLLEEPPNPALGDVGIPAFPFAKAFHVPPPALAARLCAALQVDPEAAAVGAFSAAGPYVNARLNRGQAARDTLARILREGGDYGALGESGKRPLAGRRIMVEFSSPNTNKPLHLGHLRNNALGESVSRILRAAGAEVRKVCIINDRGVHICKTMLAYEKFHRAKGDTPESLGVKGDRFVGDCYVEFGAYSKTHPDAEAEAQSLLVEWERGDAGVRALWKQMNEWAIGGIRETYQRCGVSFDAFYYESDTYLKGKAEILKGLEAGAFRREADGSVQVDLAEIGLDKKVLLRKDGTALYMTQDIGTALCRHSDWRFDQLVYVVGNEQQYHFKVLFHILKKLGFAWAESLCHLSYGMVNLPEGRMKSREGTVVDADDLIDSLREGARAEIAAKGREEAVGDADAVAEAVAIGALHYFLLQASPAKDMLFEPKESLSFNGNTGPYLQYMGARISSVLRKADGSAGGECTAEGAALLTHDAEWALVKLLGGFPAAVEKAERNFDPSAVAGLLYDIAKAFAVFYRECPILNADGAELRVARLALAECTRTALRNGMNLILVPFLETM